MGKRIDMTGWIMSEHGIPDSKLTVLYYIGHDKHNIALWHCKCECGNEFDVRGDSVRQGKTKSCGCLLKETASEKGKNSLKEIPEGTRFGKLVVLKLLKERKNNKSFYKCKCDCGTIREVYRNHLISGHTTSCGCVSSKGEFIIAQILNDNNIIFEKEKTFQDCRDINVLPFDFYVDNKYIIEFDGIQHFEEGGWNNDKNDFIKTKKHDEIKNQYCFNNNISIIRIPYTHLKNICLEDLIPETSKFLLKQG